jgi:hypothetical protein
MHAHQPDGPYLAFIRAVCGQLTATAQQHEATLDRLQRLSERLALTQQEKVRCLEGGRVSSAMLH